MLERVITEAIAAADLPYEIEKVEFLGGGKVSVLLKRFED